MGQIINAVPTAQPTVPVETHHGGHGKAHSAKFEAAHQQAAVRPHAGKAQRTNTATDVNSSRTERVDKDGKGPKGDQERGSPAKSSAAGASQTQDISPAAIVTISSAARAALAHEPETV